MSPSKPVIGLLGGGQLGRMLCEAASPLNIEIAVLDTEDCPAKKINASKKHVTGSFKDPAKVRELASKVDVLTVEIEHVDVDVLEEIAEKGVSVRASDGQMTLKKVPVHPSWKTLRLVQDKYEQKEHLRANGIAVAEQVKVKQGDDMWTSMQDITAHHFDLPWMLKARKDSYDGRGNMKISSKADYDQAVKEFSSRECYAEAWVPFTCELAVMVMRKEDASGKTTQIVPFPVVETVHEDSICSQVYMPPRDATAAVQNKAQELAVNVAKHLDGRGVFAVEMFLTPDDTLMVNEIAPRPHNSGHLTIEATQGMSQFQAQLYSVLDEESPSKLQPSVESSIMINVLGGASVDAHEALLSEARKLRSSAEVQVYIHMYDKESKPGRKIGHITVTSNSSSTGFLHKAVQPILDAAQIMRQARLGGAQITVRSPTSINASKKATVSTSKSKTSPPLVLVTMGSDSDLPVLKAGIDILTQFGVPIEVDITSAHRTPDKMAKRAREAASKGLKVIIGAAGGAAHLPGMLAAYTALPVIGVPVKATHLDGQDSLLSIVQMPRGVPVATVGINNSTNAALLAIRILGATDSTYHDKMVKYLQDNENTVLEKAETLRNVGVDAYLAKMGKK